MSLLSLHIDVDRRPVFDASRHRPIEYDRAMRCWNVLDPAQVLHLLRHKSLACETIVDGLNKVAARYGESFPNLVFVANAQPLLNEGELHVAMRRRMAAFLAKRRAPLQAVIGEISDRHLKRLATDAETDLVADCCLPLVRDYFSALVGAEAPVPFTPVTLTRIFDHWLGLGAIRQIEQGIVDLRAFVAKTCAASVAAEGEDLIVALLIVGRDSLLATLAESLSATLAQNAGGPCADMDFGEHPVETGVAIAERVAIEPVVAGEATIAKGERVRLYLQSLNYSDKVSVQRLVFGAGAHSCLGRQLSLDLWPAVTDAVRRFGRTPDSVDKTYLSNHIFVMPKKVTIRWRP